MTTATFKAPKTLLAKSRKAARKLKTNFSAFTRDALEYRLAKIEAEKARTN